MVEQPFPSIAFLWPALAVASAGEVATAFAAEMARLAGASEETTVAEDFAWATENRVVLELPTMRLRDFSGGETGPPRLICAPFALHEATIADFAPGHSLVGALRRAGLGRLLVTHWRSASADMQLLSIDSYLAELNVAVDELGGRVDIVGLCQGGWMALMFATRFPTKVGKLVLAGAPVDIGAGDSLVSRLAATVPLSVFKDLVRLGGGRIPGQRVIELWGWQSLTSAAIRDALQIPRHAAPETSAGLEARFRDWYARTVDLPGRYYIEVVDRLFKQNQLAKGEMTALGHRIDLAAMQAPVFLLAARDDELVDPRQVLATAARIGTPEDLIRTAVAPCQHLGLFMGSQTLARVWPKIARWLRQDDAALPHGRRSQAAARGRVL